MAPPRSRQALTVLLVIGALSAESGLLVLDRFILTSESSLLYCITAQKYLSLTFRSSRRL